MLVAADPILGMALAYFVYHWISELCFYAAHNWDYSVKNPKGKTMGYGNGIPITDENRMSNYARLYFGYPFFILVTGVLFCGFLFFTYKIQTCPSSDLSKCGITKSGSGKITYK